MAEKIFNTRVQIKRDTSSNWTVNNPVLLAGELVIVDTNSGDVRFKVGNGTSHYTELPFQDESILNKFPDVSEYVVAADVEGITDTVPPTFGGHSIDDFILTEDVVNTLTSSSATQPLSANQGRVLNQSINNKLDVSGGTMTGPLVADSNANYTTGQVRNIYLSTSEPNDSQGNDGDLWFVYEA